MLPFDNLRVLAGKIAYIINQLSNLKSFNNKWHLFVILPCKVCKFSIVRYFAHSHTCRSAKFCTFTHVQKCEISHIHTHAGLSAIMCRYLVWMCKRAKCCTFAHMRVRKCVCDVRAKFFAHYHS